MLYRRLSHVWTRLKERVFFRLSTPPHYESYSWGPEHSIVAKVVYRLLFCVRLISPLQWFKFAKRYGAPWGATLTAREDRSRPDYHARSTEKYFLFVLLVSFILFLISRYAGGLMLSRDIHLGHWVKHLYNVVLAVLLVESVCWTLYYLVFRPLIERRLDIFDEAEYFILLPVVFFTQVFLLACVFRGVPLADIVGVLFNGPTAVDAKIGPNAKIGLFLMGQIYLVVIIASLIRVVPEITVRRRPNITVIGYGDVVKERMLPALRDLYSPQQLAVAADFISAEDRRDLESQGIHCLSVCSRPRSGGGGAEKTSSEVLDAIGRFVGQRSSFAIVAVPTSAHLEYVLRLSRLDVKFAVEKPIVFSEAELRLLRDRADEGLFSKAFVLSYYWLEKALSLNYVLTLNPAYRQLLRVRSPHVHDPSPSAIEEHVRTLGALKSIAIEFIEGAETEQRVWSEFRSTGGLVAETLIHPFTLAMGLARACTPFDETVQWSVSAGIRWFRDRDRAREMVRHHHGQINVTFLEMRGELNREIDVYIRCGKYIDNGQATKRCLVAVYEHGYVTSDLDGLVTRVFDSRGRTILTVENIKDLNGKHGGEYQKYEHQMALVHRFFSRDWTGFRFDDYPAQLDVIHELIKISRRMPLESEIGGYDVSSEALTKLVLEHPIVPADTLENPDGFVHPENFRLPEAARIDTLSP